jgi:cation transport regulator ChaC
MKAEPCMQEPNHALTPTIPNSLCLQHARSRGTAVKPGRSQACKARLARGGPLQVQGPRLGGGRGCGCAWRLAIHHLLPAAWSYT